MDRHYDQREEVHAARSAGYASNPNANTVTEAPVAPVSQALSNLREEISDLHYNAEALINQLAPVLRNDPPIEAEQKARPCMASELAEQIQQMADSLRVARIRLASARESVTL